MLMCTWQTELWVSRCAGNAKSGWEGTGSHSENHSFRSKERVKSLSKHRHRQRVSGRCMMTVQLNNYRLKLLWEATIKGTLGIQGLCNSVSVHSVSPQGCAKCFANITSGSVWTPFYMGDRKNRRVCEKAIPALRKVSTQCFRSS